MFVVQPEETTMNSQPQDITDRPAIEAYPGQFQLPPDVLHIAIPRGDIVEEMRRNGEEATVDRVCLAVAVVVDALESARARG